MRKTAAYITSLIFLFISGMGLLHPSYEALSAWLSPLTGGYIYTVFMSFTLLIADPLKYTSVGVTWVTAGLLIGLISQKKLGASITAFFSWLSMIPTLAISFFGIYQNVEAKGLLTLDSVDKIVNFIPNIPETLSITSFLEVPIISELALTAMELMPNMGEGSDTKSMIMSIAIPYVTAVVLKPILIILGAITGAILGKLIFSRIDLNMLPSRKVAAVLITGIILSQTAFTPLTNGQEFNMTELDLERLAEMGIDLETLQMIMEMGIDLENLDIETLLELGIDPETLDIDMLMELGIDLGLDSGIGLDLGSMTSIDLDDGIYLELLAGYIDDQGRALTGEILLGSDIETVPRSEPHMRDLAASLILTQKVSDPSFLYTLPMDGVENYVQFTGMAPETFAVTLYVGEDLEEVSLKSDQLIEDYEAMYGIQFTKIISQPITFTGDGEDGASIIPSYVASAYVSLNTLEDTIPNLLTGFESKQGFADSFQEKIEGELKDVELYVTGQITPEHVEAFIPLTDIPEFLQAIVDTLLAETYHFAVGVQLINEGIPASSGETFDLIDTLGIGTPRYSSDSDLSLIAVARPNGTEVGPDIKLSISLAQDSTELMFISMYLNSMIEVEVNGGSTPTASDLQITLPGYVAPEVEVVKTRDGSSVTVTVTNEGSSTITDLSLKDAFPTKYGVLESGASEATWSMLSSGQSVSMTYFTSYENPGIYTDLPAMLHYTENEAIRVAASNTLQTSIKNPSPIGLLSDSYQATFDLVDMLTGKGDLFMMIPMVFIALIAAMDIFKMYRNRSKPAEEPSVGPEPFESSELEDSPEDPL
ncbi:hypothetical protein H8D76_01025 [Candidatus Bathyarchaeota archaeon]|nr:hypothetical protein [Candidatus Bathyarchaeota archaeon]